MLREHDQPVASQGFYTFFKILLKTESFWVFPINLERKMLKSTARNKKRKSLVYFNFQLMKILFFKTSLCQQLVASSGLIYVFLNLPSQD